MIDTPIIVYPSKINELVQQVQDLSKSPPLFNVSNTSFTFNLNKLLDNDTTFINIQVQNLIPLNSRIKLKQIIDDKTNSQILITKRILNNQNLIANQITTYPIEVKFDCVNYLFPGLYTLNCVIYNNASKIYYPFSITIEIVDKPTEEKGKSNKN